MLFKQRSQSMKHARYRIQRLIKLGEWVESREQVLRQNC